MSRPFWFRPLRLVERSPEGISQAAAHGEPLEMLLRRGAASVLETLNADRAGLWAEDAAGGDVWRGQVAQIEDLGAEIETCDVNAFEVFPVEFSEVSSPLEFFAPVFPAGPREFFEGISMAVGMPLKVHGRVLGALLAGNTRPGKLAGREVVENAAAEIAVSLYVNRAREQKQLEDRGLRLREEVERLVAIETAPEITAQWQLRARLLRAERMAAVGQLASGIAHELNNPLTSIMGYAQLLLPKLGNQHKEAKMIFDEAERARRIVKNLLFLARPAEPERTRTSVNEVIERTIGLRSHELRAHNIEVRSELDAQLPDTLADPHQIQQLVLNLIINAEQAMMENGGKAAIHVRTTRLSADWLCIEVSDTGPGVRPEIAARIFDPFFTTKPADIGTGLGLAIVRNIAEEQGGKVSVENLPQDGARFTVELPIVPLPARGTPVEGSALRRAKSLPAARILIVEDEPTVAHLIADVLREDGHRVEAVLDSQEALLRVMRSQYDLIICDLRMPRLDGPAFYDALVRARSAARHRILFITGDTLGPRTLEFLQSHQLQYLAKPFLVEELKAAAYRVLEGDAIHSPNAARV